MAQYKMWGNVCYSTDFFSFFLTSCVGKTCVTRSWLLNAY